MVGMLGCKEESQCIHLSRVVTILNGEPVKGGSYFGYEITVTEEEYNQEGGNIKKLYFKTAFDDSSSVVNVYNPYFNIATDSFTTAARI